MDPTTQIHDLAQQILNLSQPAALTTPEQFDTAVNTLPAGSTIVLATSFVYQAPFTLRKPFALQSESWVGRTGRMTVDEPAPKFLNGVVAEVDGHQLLGLDIRNASLGTLGVMGGFGSAWNRVRLLGDPVGGAHRGIEFNGGDGHITGCYVDDVFKAAQDTQAIMAWDCNAGLFVDDCHLSAAGETVMFGGADSSIPAKVPRAIRITNSDLTKKPEWLGKQQVKCALEFKSAIDVKVSNCHFEYAGTSEGQGAYLIVATVRNQNGKAPWSCIQDIEISNCTGHAAAGIVNFLGSDNNQPSGPLDGFDLHDCVFADIDGSKGSGRLFMFDRAPAHVTLQNLTVAGTNLQALGYFTGKAPTGFVAGGLTLPTSHYGWKLDGSIGSGAGHARMLAYMPDAILDSTIV